VTRSRTPLVLAVLALAAVVAAIVVLAGKTLGGPKPEDAVDSFLSDWSKGDDRGAAEKTDNPRAALAALTANRKGLDKARLVATRDSVKENGDDATAQVRMEWTVPKIGLFAYGTELKLHKEGDKWKVRWAPTVVHPDLDRDTRLGTTAEPGKRAPIRDRNGQALVTERPVVRVGVTAGKVKRPRQTAVAIDHVVDIDVSGFTRAIRGAGPGQFVPAITLREADARAVESRLEAIPGVELVAGTAQLAPSKEFGRAVLGAVTDGVGQGGLEGAYDKQLAGTGARKVVIRARGVPIDTLQTRRARRGRPLRTTLDRHVQQAAEDALGGEKRNAALVAIQPSTGDVLAVANRPADLSYDRAIEGRYPPGSTFKVVSTAALLRRGLKTTDTVECPKSIKVGGRAFKNFEGEAGGSVPFSKDFAISCNTAFVSLSDRLKQRDLTRVARDYGLGRKPALGLNAPPASVPPPSDQASQAAMMIGQDRILASPLSMAGVAATVAEGRWRAPRLVSTDPRTAAPPLDSGEVSTLRTLMRDVVTSGTGTALAGVPGEPRGKSGTAEFGNKNPPDTHAWFIAFRGDVAIAVLVERGEAGGRVAAPIAAKFFTRLGSG
jgi:cell division protein FtsI/penicillin-binding protein 2